MIGAYAPDRILLEAQLLFLRQAQENSVMCAFGATDTAGNKILFVREARQ